MASVYGGIHSLDKTRRSGVESGEAGNHPARLAPHGASKRAGSSDVDSTRFGDVSCTSSKLEGKTTNAGGALGVNVTASLKVVSWGGCTCNGFGATMTAGNLNWGVAISGTGNKDGTMEIIEPRVTVECEGKVCNYQTLSTANVQLKGGAPASLVAAAGQVFFERTLGSNGACAKSAEWDATYLFSAPNPLFVTKT